MAEFNWTPPGPQGPWRLAVILSQCQHRGRQDCALFGCLVSPPTSLSLRHHSALLLIPLCDAEITPDPTVRPPPLSQSHEETKETGGWVGRVGRQGLEEALDFLPQKGNFVCTAPAAGIIHSPSQFLPGSCDLVRADDRFLFVTRPPWGGCVHVHVHGCVHVCVCAHPRV